MRVFIAHLGSWERVWDCFRTCGQQLHGVQGNFHLAENVIVGKIQVHQLFKFKNVNKVKRSISMQRCESTDDVALILLSKFE